MPELVALACRGQRFVDELIRTWDQGDAVLPVDHRLPDAARQQLLERLAPTVIVDPDGQRSRRAGRPVEPGDALVVATSGSTGEPKGVVLTHEAVEASARSTSDRLGVEPSRDRWLACLPLAHIGGLSVVTRALLTGTPLEVHDGFETGAVDASEATFVSLVPTALGRIDPTRWRTILLGGSAPPPSLADNVVTTYGMSETGSGIVYDGRPLAGVEVRSIAGELWVRGPMLLRAYRDGHDPRDDQGWLPTGDAGEVVEGRVVVHGRVGDMIISGGENVWPEPVERRLESHPAVAEAAVIGRADPEWGQRVVALVVPTDRSAPPTLGELRDWVSAQLPVWCAPRQLELVGSLPRTPLGKLRRREAGARS